MKLPTPDHCMVYWSTYTSKKCSNNKGFSSGFSTCVQVWTANRLHRVLWLSVVYYGTQKLPLQHVTTRYNMLQHVTSTSMFRDCRPAALLPAPSVLNTRPGAILPWSWLKTGFHAEVQTSQLPRRLDDNPCIIQETHMDTYMVYIIIKIYMYIYI